MIFYETFMNKLTVMPNLTLEYVLEIKNKTQSFYIGN